jgi:hypothetical protein
MKKDYLPPVFRYLDFLRFPELVRDSREDGMMPGGVLHTGSRARLSRSLVARGGLARTFGGLACFLRLTFLGAGIYILADALANPIEA